MTQNEATLPNPYASNEAMLPDPYGPGAAPTPSPFGAGIQSGLQGIKASGAGVLAAAGEIAGLPAVKQYGLEVARGAQAASAENNVAPAFSLDFLKFATGQMGTALLPALATGVLGRLGAGVIAKGIPDIASQLIVKNAGIQAGVATGFAAQNIGSIYPAAVDAGVPDPLARSVIGGTVAAGAAMVPGMLLANRLGLFAGSAAERIAAQRAAAVAAGETTFGGTTAASLAKGFAGGALEQGVAGGAGLAAQTAATRATLNQPLTGPEANAEYLNSAATGFAGSLIPGALSGLVSGIHPAGRIEAPAAPAAPETVPAASETVPSLVGPVTEPQAPLALIPKGLALVDNSPAPRGPEIPIPAGTEQRAKIFEPPVLGEQTPPRPTVSDIITPAQYDMLTLAERMAQNATEQNAIETGVQSERQNGIRGRQTTEAGAGNRILSEGQGEQAARVRGQSSVETQLALIKRSRGLLLSSEEAKAANEYAKTAPAVEIAKSSSRGAISQPGARAARDNFVNAFSTGVDKAVAELTFLNDKKQTTLKSALNAAAERAIKAKTPEEAQAILDAGMDRAIKGKIPQIDAETFRERLSDMVVKAAPEIISSHFSKAAEMNPNPDLVAFSHWGDVPVGEKTDPTKLGRGIRGADQAAAKAVGLDYTSAVVRGSKYTEPDVQSKPERVGVLNADKIYQFRRDDPMLAQAREQIKAQFGPDEQIAQMQYAKNVRDAGYDAMQYPNGQLRIFKSQEVHPVISEQGFIKTAEVATASHNTNGGSSYNAVTGRDYGGTLNYAVSPFKDRELVIPGKKVTSAILRQYAKINSDLLGDPRNIMGTWYNEKDGNSYVDVSTITSSYARAMDIAAKANQKAIYDLRTYEEIATGTPLDTNRVMSMASTARFDGIMLHKANQMLAKLESIVGKPSRLAAVVLPEVKGGTGVTHFGRVRDLIELSLQAKDGDSLAAHEGYHYLERRVLSSTEQAIIARAFRPGSDLYNELVQKAKAYDAANNTKITDAISADLKETRAYGFEFWNRGELTPSTILGRVWKKITDVMKRVSNMMHGLGFQSHEDIFYAIRQGEYAARKANPLGEYLAPAFSQAAPEALAMANANQQALAEFRAGRNPDFLFSQAAESLSLDEAGQRMAAGELSHAQFNLILARYMDDRGIPQGLRDKIVDPGLLRVGSAYGTFKHFMAKNFYSGMNLARQSEGYKNGFNVLSAFGNRKSVLIADAVEKRLSTWVKNTSKDDRGMASKAVLERTVNEYKVGSDGYNALRSRLTDTQRKMFDEATDMISHMLDEEFKAESVTYKKLLGDGSEAFQEWSSNRAVQVEQMKANGYFPEKRYGDHAVYGYVTTPEGKQVTAYYSQHGSEAEARSVLASIRQDTEGQGLIFGYGYKHNPQYNGSSSFGEFLSMAERAGIVLTQAEKERIGKALISADSAKRNRVFRRENIAGYSEEGMRVLAEFGVATANKIALAELGDAMRDAVAGREVDVKFTPEGRVQVNYGADQNVWVRDGEGAGFYHNLLDGAHAFATDPKQVSPTVSKLRAAASLNLIGGSLSGAFVNMTALPMIALPWLTQHTTYTNAGAKILGAIKIAGGNYKALTDLNRLLDPHEAIHGIDEVSGLRQALQIAAQDGTNQAAETYNAMGLSRGASFSFSGKTQKAINVWMAPFQISETMNRLSTFIAAYKIAKERGDSNEAAHALAKDAVDNTQFRYDDANLPKFARNGVGRLLFTFKSFPLYSTELLFHLAKENPKAAAFMLGSLSSMAGVQGVPFAEDIENLVDTVAQRLFHSPFNTRRWMTNMMKDGSEALTGVDLSSVMLHGIANTMTELNFASRVGNGHMIPGSTIGVPGADYSSVLQDIAGPVGSQMANYVRGLGSITNGQFETAGRQLLPLAAQNIWKGAQEWSRGYATDIGGNKTVDVTRWESLWQFAGFSSNALTKAYDAVQIDKQQNAFHLEAKRSYEDDIVRAMTKDDMAGAQEAMNAAQAWDRAHPDMQMHITASSIRKQAQQAGMNVNQRMLARLPKQLRAGSQSYQLIQEQE